MINSIFSGKGDCESVKTGEGELDYKTKYPFSRKEFVSSSSSIDVHLCEFMSDIEEWVKRLESSKPLTKSEHANLHKHLVQCLDSMNEAHHHLCLWDGMECDQVILTEDK